MTKKEIQSSKKGYELMPVKRESDLLNAKPIVSHKNYVYARNKIGAALLLTADCLGIELSDLQLQTITEDLIDKYSHDSIEDILWTLKKGRQGSYGEIYGKLNMIVLSSWMEEHLANKARLRVEESKKKNIETKEPIAPGLIDYEKFKARTAGVLPDRKREKDSKESDYQNWKMKYLTNRKKTEK